jgi:hypothetical protein
MPAEQVHELSENEMLVSLDCRPHPRSGYRSNTANAIFAI